MPEAIVFSQVTEHTVHREGLLSLRCVKHSLLLRNNNGHFNGIGKGSSTSHKPYTKALCEDEWFQCWTVVRDVLFLLLFSPLMKLVRLLFCISVHAFGHQCCDSCEKAAFSSHFLHWVKEIPVKSVPFFDNRVCWVMSDAAPRGGSATSMWCSKLLSWVGCLFMKKHKLQEENYSREIRNKSDVQKSQDLDEGTDVPGTLLLCPCHLPLLVEPICCDLLEEKGRQVFTKQTLVCAKRNQCQNTRISGPIFRFSEHHYTKLSKTKKVSEVENFFWIFFQNSSSRSPWWTAARRHSAGARTFSPLTRMCSSTRRTCSTCPCTTWTRRASFWVSSSAARGRGWNRKRKRSGSASWTNGAKTSSPRVTGRKSSSTLGTLSSSGSSFVRGRQWGDTIVLLPSSFAVRYQGRGGGWICVLLHVWCQ